MVGRSTFGAALLAAASPGCGGAGDVPQHRPRLCGEEGPVHVLRVDEPFRSLWSVLPVGERWIVHRWATDEEPAGSFSFATDAIGPCGEEPVTLPSRLWPIPVGDALFGCDVDNGNVYTVDARTGDRGELLASDLQCDALTVAESSVVMVDESTGSVVVVRNDGAVLRLAIPFEIGPEFSRLAPALINPSYAHNLPLVGLVSAERGGSEVWAVGDDAGLWRLHTADGTAALAAEGVSRFRIDTTTGLVVAEFEEEASPGLFRAAVIDPETDEVWEAPPVPRVAVGGGYLLLEDGALDLLSGDRQQLRPGIFETEYAYLDPEGRLVLVDGRIVVWDIPTGVMAIDEPAPSLPCEFPRAVGGVLEVRWGVENSCGPTELWAYALDGSKAELVRREEDGRYGELVSNDGLLVAPWGYREQPGDFEYQDRGTGERVIIDGGVDARVGGPDEATLLYRVRDGIRSGLWRSELPQ